jgi:aspartate racemase
MPRHIGIVACSAEGAALCYRTISWNPPIYWGRAIIRNPDASRPIRGVCELHLAHNDWAGVAERMLSSPRKRWKT